MLKSTHRGSDIIIYVVLPLYRKADFTYIILHDDDVLCLDIYGLVINVSIRCQWQETVLIGLTNTSFIIFYFVAYVPFSLSKAQINQFLLDVVGRSSQV